MTWEDITISQYLGIAQMVEKHQKFGDKSNNIDYICDLLWACTGKPKDSFLERPVEELNSLWEDIKFIMEPPKSRFTEVIEVNGKKYNVSISMRDISTAQYIDYTETLKNDPENIAMMCAIFCIPEGHKYNEGYQVVDLAEEFFDSFKIVDAMGISFFFTQLLKSYVKATLNFSKRQLKKEKRKLKKNPDKIKAITASIEVLKSVGGLI